MCTRERVCSYGDPLDFNGQAVQYACDAALVPRMMHWTLILKCTIINSFAMNGSFFALCLVLIVLNIFLKIEQNVTSHIVKFTSGGFACKLPSLEINLDKLFCSGGQRRRTITVGLHFLPQGNFQNNSQVKPRLSCLGCCEKAFFFNLYHCGCVNVQG